MQEVGGSIPPGSTTLRPWGFAWRSHGKLEGRSVVPGEARRAKTGWRFGPAYSPTTALSRSRSATISSLAADNSAIEHEDASRIDSGTARALSFRA